MAHDPIELSGDDVLDRAAPVLRGELTFRPQAFAGRDCFVVEDPATGRFFRIGLDEYTFVSLLDGQTTIRAALTATRGARPACRFTPTDAVAICHWLQRAGLLTEDASRRSGPATPPPRHAGRRGHRWGPLCIQLPLFHPDRFFERVTPWLGWIFSTPALGTWLLLLGLAARDLLANVEGLRHASGGILSAQNWLWLGLAWLGLKTIHECGHAIACKRLGGDVPEAGVMLILFAPLAYVDVTSCWRLRSKWARIQVAAAGMIVELTVAAATALVWCRTPPGPLNQTCFNMLITAGIMTVLFNANPLMRFDGYYILSDLLELPNLYGRGQQYVAYLTERLLFGLPTTPPPLAGPRGLLIRAYALASLAWRNLVFAGLVLTAATLFHGAGIALAAAAIAAWAWALIRRLAHLARGAGTARPNWVQFALVSSGMAVAAGVLLGLTPWPGAVTAPAIVRYAPEIVVRAGSDGFVKELHVQPGQSVAKNQLLVVLENPELTEEVAQLTLDVQKSELQIRIHLRKRELGQAQAEHENLRNLEKRLRDKQEELDHLTVRAPRAGHVVGRNLVTLSGTYLTRGSEVLTIGNEQTKELRVSVAQPDIDAFRESVGQPIRAYLNGTRQLLAPLARIEPRASLTPLDISLCATHGGPLDVRKLNTSANAVASGNYELLAPNFTAIVALDPRQSLLVRSGQRATVALRPFESIGHHLYRRAANWVDQKLKKRHSHGHQ